MADVGAGEPAANQPAHMLAWFQQDGWATLPLSHQRFTQHTKQVTMLGLPAASLCTPAFCEWIQVAVPANTAQTLSTTNQSLTITDPGRPGSGTFTLTGTSGTAGGALIGRDFGWYPSGTFSGFPSNGFDPTDADQFVVGTVSGCSGSSFCNVSGAWDFSGIGAGFLPAGSDFVITDLDAFEALTALNATAFGPISGNVPWLQVHRSVRREWCGDKYRLQPNSI